MDRDTGKDINGSSAEPAKDEAPETKYLEMVSNVTQIEAEIRRLNLYCEMRKNQCEMMSKETEELKQKLALKKAVLEQMRARARNVQDEIKVRRENIEKEKQMCQLLFEKKHEIRRKTTELQKKFDKKKEQWRLMTENSKKLVEDYEQKWLSMPWAAEYKKLYDENKRLDQQLAFTRGLIDEKKKEIAALEEDLSRSQTREQFLKQDDFYSVSDPQRSWNKVCVQFANDMVHTGRLQAQLVETRSKLEEAKLRRARKQARHEKVVTPVPSTPVQTSMPPKTPQTAPGPRSGTVFKTPVSTVGSAIPKTPQSCQPAFNFKTPGSNAAASSRNKTPGSTSSDSNKQPVVSPHSPFKVPRLDVSPHSPGPQKISQASPQVAESDGVFKAPTAVVKENSGSRLRAPLTSARVEPPPPRSESPVTNDYFNFGGLLSQSDENDENSDSGSGMGGFQLDFGDDGGDGDDDEDNGMTARFSFNF